MWKRHLRIAFSYLFLLLQLKVLLVETVNETIPVNLGLVIDFEDWIGKVGLSCIDMALKDFYGTHAYYKTRLVLNIRDSKRDVVAAASAALALDLMKNIQVEAIIGPTTSKQVNFITQLGEKAKVPIISFAASTPSLTTIQSPYFFQATPNDSAQVNAISAIIQAFGWREAVLVYVDDEYGVGIIPYLTDALQAVDTQVPYRSAISPLARDSQIIEKLYKLKEMRSRVCVVHMLPDLGSRLFINAKKIGMMGKGYVWIITYRMTAFLDSMDSFVIESMQGVLGIKPHVPMEKLKNFQVQWQRKFHQDNPEKDDAKLNMYGLWAYDATIALAMTVENVSTRTKNFDFEKSSFSSNSTTDLETTGVSQIGETALVPKGWEDPTDGKKLRIGVPVKKGFMQFVNVTIDTITNTSSVKGFCIDLFDAVVKELAYSLLYDYIPFANPNGKSAGSYNDLVYQVQLGKFDAVVGDISIVANRSQYVDFTLPYTGAGTVSMIVVTTDEEIWVLEHRINEEFQGSHSQQVFPRGSPLTADVSRAILKVIEGDKSKEIEEKWFGKQVTCPDRSNSVPSNRLGLNSFWGLFLIAGVASLLSLIIYMAMFIHKNRGILITSDSNASLWSRILELLRIFKQKDFRSHTCRKSDENEPSSSTFAMDTDFLEEQRTSSPESQEAALNIEFC
ncbi:hypothetical protein JCGZ_10903 [Jatropha curcas]|uniref:Ionotropic glutamate receptor C-terminal domain-containing protein n=1 Tax=Jatropha curcas TaxID=180498 RepID=A0A067KIA1_JATCU|nr:hypothetical protein JCGZ_10903 [Jatropha curcas]